MSSSPDGMMLWTDAYLADTGHLSTFEHGAYLLILMAMWRNGGMLPDDDLRLARTIRSTVDKWRRIAPAIRNLLMVSEDGFLTQKRLWQEMKIARSKREKLRVAGKHGNDAKSLKNKETTIANGNATLYARRPTLTLTLEEERKKRSNKSAPRARATALPTDWIPSATDRDFARSKNWTDERINFQAERFKNHALGNGRTQVNWPAAWRNWVTSPLQQKENGNVRQTGFVPRPGSREDRAEQSALALAKLRDFANGHNSDDEGAGGEIGQPPFGGLPFPKPA